MNIIKFALPQSKVLEIPEVRIVVVSIDAYDMLDKITLSMCKPLSLSCWLCIPILMVLSPVFKMENIFARLVGRVKEEVGRTEKVARLNISSKDED
ncbi:hypothetical protein E2C01_010161 [Portunus trituberculatus]|uniref:Uncharacterized protein n=1 Tax=Portunus trituberculatus TaxID=210409 RepID=A0A5B7D7M6_PORTR|nr:hypothetical protein [Portunus trituberculatus]